MSPMPVVARVVAELAKVLRQGGQHQGSGESGRAPQDPVDHTKEAAAVDSPLVLRRPGGPGPGYPGYQAR